jgi:hemolysin III
MDGSYPTAFGLRDPVCSLTHLAAAVFGVFVTLLLWRLTRGDRRKRLSLVCFGLTMVVLYAASGTYHAIDLPLTSPEVDFFRRLDHSAIYALIAGTYTPVFAVVLAHCWARRLLPLVWALAATGIALKWLVPVASDPLTVGLYLGLGWFGILSVVPLSKALGWQALAWGGLGGLLYTAGAVCELAQWPVILPGWFAWHEVMHVCDMGGTAAHVVFMVGYVVPFPSAAAEPPLPGGV